MNTTEPRTVDFWFDPICPWSWMTSRWILEVEQVRPVWTRWHVMSLAILQENPRLPRAYQQMLLDAQGPARVCAAAQQEYGAELVGPLYTALGSRFHQRGLPQNREVVEDALAEVGLPLSLADHLTLLKHDKALRQSHRAAVALVGDDVGTPVIALESPDEGGQQVAFFGPVVTPTPRGEAAGSLWDGVVLVSATPGFSELKRTRTHGPDFR
ncbi:disulfide bond formation protein DsbA [Streptomyces diastatochromogenes]|uniref:mycothiol-dependent nitroreductase Rv2466c family protein n=1 Tax=Streptomyces diastatochromogenes TaxID=42236 RepID=UPI00364B296C